MSCELPTYAELGGAAGQPVVVDISVTTRSSNYAPGTCAVRFQYTDAAAPTPLPNAAQKKSRFTVRSAKVRALVTSTLADNGRVLHAALVPNDRLQHLQAFIGKVLRLQLASWRRQSAPGAVAPLQLIRCVYVDNVVACKQG